VGWISKLAVVPKFDVIGLVGVSFLVGGEQSYFLTAGLFSCNIVIVLGWLRTLFEDHSGLCLV
jgi:hypothetical protein